MKCPNCDTNNGKTNKYCRGCGTRLDVLVPKATEPEVVREDEVALGEELFRVHELFESGDLDAALEKSEKLASEHESSASAHSIVAMVYERKAEKALSDGDMANAHDFLKLAIDRYEKIIDLNPDSAADREKLASLRMKYTGQTVVAPEKAKEHLDFIEALKAVPKPALAGFCAFLVLLALAIIFTGSSAKESKITEVKKTLDKSTVTVTQNAPSEPTLSVYTFPPATNSSPTPAPSIPVPKVSKQVSVPSFVEVRPVKLPKINQELTLVPEPKAAPKRSTIEPVKVIASQEPVVSSSSSGGTLLAKAIKLHDQGRITEAIGAANQATALYKAEVDANRNIDAAKRGIANATKLISIWQSQDVSSE